jgi:hypothetical protein
MTNRSHKLAMVEFNDMVFWVDPDELKLTYDYRHLALSFVPLAVVIAMVCCVSLFQARRATGSWTLAFKVCMRRTAQLFATSSPP